MVQTRIAPRRGDQALFREIRPADTRTGGERPGAHPDPDGRGQWRQLEALAQPALPASSERFTTRVLGCG